MTHYTLPHEKRIDETIKAIEKLKEENAHNPLFANEIERMEEKLQLLKEEVYSQLTPWERIQICRHPERPSTLDFIEHICDRFESLAGDRLFKDDQALIGGLATIEDQKYLIIGQEKGNDTESRLQRNFGMMHPEGYRKALRLMRLAEKFQLPIISFIDTKGAYPGLEAEERGQGWAIAENLRAMAAIETPIVVIIIGEGCSGGALGIGMGDAIGMLQHAYYSVISPEGCASILWKDPSKKMEASSALKIHAENLLSLGVIDEIIAEPLGGAHHDPSEVYGNVKTFISKRWEQLKTIRPEILLEERYQKYRKMGIVNDAPPDKITRLPINEVTI